MDGYWALLDRYFVSSVANSDRPPYFSDPPSISVSTTTIRSMKAMPKGALIETDEAIGSDKWRVEYHFVEENGELRLSDRGVRFDGALTKGVF